MESNPLRIFIGQLVQLDLPYWIDSGSLLGLYREKQLLPWDHDIDIGMWVNDLTKIKKFAELFEAKGFILDFQNYHGKLYNIECKSLSGTFEKNIPIHIHGYVEKDGVAYAPQVIVCDPKPKLQPNWAINEPSHVRNFLLFCKRESIYARDKKSSGLRRILALLLAYPIWGGLCTLRNPLDRKKWVEVWPLRLLYKIYTWVVPSDFYLSLDAISVSGMELSIPSNTESYLTYRYGDWEIPRPEWVYWRDDKALKSAQPTEFNVW